MILTEPLRVITPTLDAGVLQVLASADATFTTGQIRALAGRGTARGVRLVLERLAGQGIVTATWTPAATLYQLNRQHLAAEPVIALAGLYDAFLTRLRGAFAALPTPPSYAALFGSAARGQMRTDSDIDLLVVRPAGVDPDDPVWCDPLAQLTADTTAWTGNDARILEYGAEAFTAERISAEPTLTAALAEGITLCGEHFPAS